MSELIADLLLIETRVLRGIYDAGGEAAFDGAARELLFHTAALIAHVCGPQRMRGLFDAIEVNHPIQ